MNDWRTSKQWVVFESFRSGLGLPENWMACYNDPPLPPNDPAPDVLMRTPEGIAGIELTEFFQDFHPETGSAQERLYRMHEDIVGRAREAYRVRNPGQPLHVSVQWLDDRDFDRMTRRRISTLLVEIAEAKRPSPSAPPIPESIADETLAGFRLDDVFDRIAISRMPAGTTDWWSFVPIVYAHSMPEQIPRYIEEKEAKLDAYRVRCSTVWLVIHSGRGGLDLTDEVLDETYATNFDRVFLFDEYRPRPAQLKIRPRALRPT